MSLIKLCIFLLQFTVSFSVFGESFTSKVISSSEWDVANNPKLFFKNIDYTFRETSRESHLSTEKKLWSDDYWARYRGSIAYRWQDGQRPERDDLYRKSQIRRLKKSDRKWIYSKVIMISDSLNEFSVVTRKAPRVGKEYVMGGRKLLLIILKQKLRL